jgi:5-methylthioadenosine/S-adenosylhomocysteine deaminase
MVAVHAERVLRWNGSDPVVDAAAVQIEGHSITAVTPMDRHAFLERCPSGEALGDVLLAPAFVNGHSHIAMAPMRGMVTASAVRSNLVEDLFFRVESHLQSGDVRAFARMGAWECLGAGTGAVWDHYYAGTEVAEALVDVGLHGVVAPTLQDLSGPGVHQLEAQIAATLELAASTRFREAGVVAALGPHATDTVSDALWLRVRTLAERHDLPVHAHLSQSMQELHRVRESHGCTSVERLRRLGVLDLPRVLLVHALYTTAQDLGVLARSATTLGYCPHSQMQFGYPAPLDRWRALGIATVLGTDAGVSNDGMDVQLELRAVAGQHSFAVTFGGAHREFCEGSGTPEAVDAARQQAVDRAPNAAATLATATTVPGGLHPGLLVGTIAPGARANLAVYDPRHPALWPAADAVRALVASNLSGALQRLMIGGQWHLEATRPLQSAAFREHHAEASRRRTLLLERAGIR